MGPGLMAVGVLMGIAFAAPPGAVTAETFRRGVRGGFAFALQVQLGSLIGDATYAVLALAGLAAVAENPVLRIGLGAAGATFLLYLAYQSFASTRAPDSLPSEGQAGSTQRGAFITGLAISLTNPWAIAFWLSLGSALGSLGLLNASLKEVAVFFTCFMLGSALWAVVLAAAIARVRAWIGPRVFRLVSVSCGLVLGSFGLVAASRVVTSVLRF